MTSNKVSFGKTDFKQFIRHKIDKKVKPLYIVL